jgi:hypothetical protein
MRQILIDSAMNCLTTERRWNDNPSRFAIFPFRSPDLVQVKHQIANKATDRFFHALKSFCQKNLRNL